MKTKLYILAMVALATVMAACTPSNDPTPGKGTEMAKSAKRGVAFNFTNVMDLPLMSPYISWDYNWGNSTNDNAATWFDANDVEFCPMCWSGNYSADKIRTYVTAHPSVKYLLAFNEPNLTDQANMTPAVAATYWPDVVALAKELNLKLVAPAMNYGTLSGYSDPIKWLDEFFAQPGVSIDDVDALSIHCYMASASALEGYVERFYKYNKPIWMTEFCAWESSVGSVDAQMNYMCTVLNYLEQNEKVERYAWFIPRYKSPGTYPYMQLLTNGSDVELTDLGKMFCWFSSFDTTAWLPASRFIHAGEYVELSTDNTIVRPTTDTAAISLAGKDGLMVQNMTAGQTIGYQVYVSQKTSSIDIRYSNYSDGIMEVIVDGKSMNYANLQKTGAATVWASATTSLALAPGQHLIVLSLTSGSCYLSGFMLH